MESLKRHSLLSLIFILNFFSKTSVIRNVNLSSYYRVKIFRSPFFLFVILNCCCCCCFFFLWMRVRRGSRGTFGAGHLIPSIFVLFWFKIGYKTVLILDMIHSSWLHLGRPDMKHYPLMRMWRLVTSPARYELFISPGQASGRVFFFKVDLAFNPLRPKSDQHEISPYNINSLENRLVMRIEYMIRKDESNWYFNKFSPLLLLKTYRDNKWE